MDSTQLYRSQRWTIRSTIGCVLALASLGAGQVAPAAEDQAAGSENVTFEGLTLQVPKSWKQQPPANRLRLGQFEVPGPKVDDPAAELSVFNFGASDVGANIRRWIATFQPEGRKATTVSGKCPQGQYYLVDVQGTFNRPVGPPIAGRTEAAPNSRMLAVMLVVKDKGAYFLKLVGAAPTVTAAGDSLRASFGADKTSEMPYDANP